MKQAPRYKLYGDSGILVEWEAIISEEILKDIIRFQRKVEKVLEEKIIECIPAYHSLLIIFNSPISSDGEINQLTEIYEQEEPESDILSSRIWNIPVCYHQKFGMDLMDLAEKKGMDPQKIIQLHTSTLYTVHFIGFLPGFPYLGGLNPKLHEPRKKAPLREIPKGSVAIGGDQTGIYPCKSPGGWHVIGNTPINMFEIHRDPPCFVQTGDRIRFIPVSIEKHQELSLQVFDGSFIIQREMVAND